MNQISSKARVSKKLFYLRANSRATGFELRQADSSSTVEFGSWRNAFDYVQTLATSSQDELLVCNQKGAVIFRCPLLVPGASGFPPSWPLQS